MRKNNYYIIQFIRTLKEFDEYNIDNMERLYMYSRYNEAFNYLPHVFCINALSYSVKNHKKHIKMKRFYLNCIMEQYIKDLRNYLNKYKIPNYHIYDYEFKENIKQFSLFSFLRNRFGIGEPSKDEYITIFYNG